MSHIHKKHEKRIRFAGACLAVGVLVASLPQIPTQLFATTTQDKLDAAGNKIDKLEDELDGIDDTISSYERQQNALEQKVASGEDKISSLAAELEETQNALADKQEDIKKTQAELEQARAVSQTQYDQMKLRIRFMYENSTTSILTYVLESGSFAEALRRVNYFQTVMSYDRNKLEEYKKTVRKINRQKKRLTAERQELSRLEETQEAKLDEIDAAVQDLKSQLGDMIWQLQSTKSLREKYEQQLQAQKDLEAELERQKAEEDRQRMEEIRRQEEELERQRQQELERQQQEEQQQQQQDTSGAGSSGAGASGGSYAASASDLELLATIIYCEAGSEPYEGQLAVGSVVMNRVASSSFPNTISGVIYQSGQFSPVASGRFAQALATGEGEHCMPAAREVLAGRRNVSCLYFRVDNGLIDGQVIGHHVFY